MIRKKPCHPSTVQHSSPYPNKFPVTPAASYLVTPILDNLAMQSLLPFPPAPPCSDYCPRPPFFCCAFGDLLIIHCLEHVKKPAGVREVLGLSPVGLCEGDMQVSALKQRTRASCGVLQLTRSQQRSEIQVVETLKPKEFN